jgi:Domain of Unknown Function (DUF1521)
MVTVTTKITINSRAHQNHIAGFHVEPKNNGLNMLASQLLKGVIKPHHNENGNLHQALALAAPLIAQRPKYSFSNNSGASILRNSLIAATRQMSPRQQRLMSRIYRVMQSPFGFGHYMAAKAISKALSKASRMTHENDYKPYNKSSALFGGQNNYNSPMRPQSNLLSQLRNEIGDRCPTQLNNCDKGNLLSLALNNTRSSLMNPTGFVPSADGKKATLNYGQNLVAFDQTTQKLSVTNYKNGIPVDILKIEGDPHETTIDPKTGVKITKDFNGSKNYKLPDGTQMTVVTGKPAGSNALTTAYSVILTKKGERPVMVDNLSNQNNDGRGIVAQYTDKQVARTTKNAAVSMSTINDKGEIVA